MPIARTTATTDSSGTRQSGSDNVSSSYVFTNQTAFFGNGSFAQPEAVVSGRLGEIMPASSADGQPCTSLPLPLPLLLPT
jgi:hypothetical protein